MQNSQFATFLTESLRTVEAIGERKTIDAIINARKKPKASTVEERIELYIIEKSCEAFNTHPVKLKSSRTYNEVMDVKMFCYVLLKKHLGYSLSQTKDIMGCNKSTVSRGLEYFSNLKESIKPDKKRLDLYRIVDGQVATFVKSIKK